MSLRRFVNLVSRDSMKSVYTLRRIDVSRFFLPTAITNSRTSLPPPMKDGCCLPESTINFYSSQRPMDCGDMDFMLIDNKVVATDTTGGAFIYDPDRHAVRSLPSHARPKKHVASLAVGDDLYFIDRITQGTARTRTFEALVYTPSLHGNWHWRALPPPPPPPPPGVQNSADDLTSIECSSRIWVSARGHGAAKSCIHLFDTEKLVWNTRRPADWVLPFRGGAEYVPELNKLWIGISSRDHGSVFCASDLSAASASRPPVLHAALDDMAGAPEEWRLISASAVHLGSGKFCVARIFCLCTRSMEEGHVHHDVKQFAVLAGVEVVSRDGGEVSMVQHNSERYMLCDDDELHWVL